MTDEQRDRRIRHHMYDTLEGIREQSERIVALEELVADIWTHCPVDEGACEECGRYKATGRGGRECEFLTRLKMLDVPL